jgi:hypothetical protein
VSNIIGRDVEKARDNFGTLPSNRRTQHATVEAAPRRARGAGRGAPPTGHASKRHAEDMEHLRQIPVTRPQVEDFVGLDDGEELHRAALHTYARHMNARKAQRRLRGGR